MSSPAPARVLVVEDDRDFAELVKISLEQEGYRVDVEHDGTAGQARADAEAFDLVLLDWMLPGTDGTDICRHLRAREQYTPIMMLTARDCEVDRVLGLELGADDYLSKPISVRELIARVRALLRRANAMRSPAQTSILERGSLRIELAKRRATFAAKEINLTAKEFDLLAHFAGSPGVVFTRQELLETVWGYRFDGYEHTVNSHINRLRNKLRPAGCSAALVETVWGVGYKFREEPQS